MSSRSKVKIEIHSYTGNSWQLKRTKIWTKTWMIFTDISLREKKADTEKYIVDDSYRGISRTDETNQIAKSKWGLSEKVEMFYFLIRVVFTWAKIFDKVIDPYTSMGILLYVNYTLKKLFKKKDMVTLCRYVNILRSRQAWFPHL